MYGCCICNREVGGNVESYTSIGDAEQGTYRPPITPDEVGNTPKSPDTHPQAPIRETAGFWVYIFQVLFQVSVFSFLTLLDHLVEGVEDCTMTKFSVWQTCAGAVVLTDVVFWGLLYPFTKGYKLSFVSCCSNTV